MRQLLVPLLLTAVSAVLIGLAFPPPGWTPLAWLALAPFFLALRRTGLGGALLLTWLWCVVAAYVVGDWFPRSVATYFLQPMPVAIGLFVAVFTTMAAPYYMAFAAAYRVLGRRFGLLLPLLAGAAWVGAELGRGRLFTGTPFFIGNPWGLVGYSQVDHLALVQVASLTGIYGVSFAVACVNAGLAELWTGFRTPGASKRRALAALGLAALPALLVAIHGHAVLRAAAPRVPSPATRIAIVQDNLKIGSRWRSDYYGRNLGIYLALTERVTAAGSPQIVFWPESSMTFFLEQEPLYRRAISRLQRAREFELVAGGPRAVGTTAPLYYNSIFVLAPDGDISDRYDKEHLVPFAEYFPLRIDLLKRRFGRIRMFEPGQQTAPLRTRAGLAGVLVCNEAMLPEVAAERVARGARYLLNPSNDTWISERKYAAQQFHIVRMRAIEQRRYLVRASTTGPSAVVDPWGRIQAATQAFTRDVLLGEIRPSDERTVYGRIGDLFALLCVACVGIALLAARGRR